MFSVSYVVSYCSQSVSLFLHLFLVRLKRCKTLCILWYKLPLSKRNALEKQFCDYCFVLKMMSLHWVISFSPWTSWDYKPRVCCFNRLCNINSWRTVRTLFSLYNCSVGGNTAKTRHFKYSSLGSFNRSFTPQGDTEAYCKLSKWIIHWFHTIIIQF